MVNAVSDAQKVQFFTDALQRCQTDVDRMVASLSVDEQHELHVHETIEAVVAGTDSVSKEAVAGLTASHAPDEVVALDDSDEADPDPAPVSSKYDAIEDVIAGCDSVSLASKEPAAGSTSATQQTPTTSSEPPAPPKPKRRSKANKTDAATHDSASASPLTEPKIRKRRSTVSASLASKVQTAIPSTEHSAIPAPKRRNSVRPTSQTAESAPSTQHPAVPKRRNSVHSTVSAPKRRNSVRVTSQTAEFETSTEHPTKQAPKRRNSLRVASKIDEFGPPIENPAVRMLKLQNSIRTAVSTQHPAIPKRRNSVHPTVSATKRRNSVRARPIRNFDAIEAVIAGLDSASIAAQGEPHVCTETLSKHQVNDTQPTDIPMQEPNTSQSYANGNTFPYLRRETETTTVPTSPSQSNRSADEIPENLNDYVPELHDVNAINLVRSCTFENMSDCMISQIFRFFCSHCSPTKLLMKRFVHRKLIN